MAESNEIEASGREKEQRIDEKTITTTATTGCKNKLEENCENIAAQVALEKSQPNVRPEIRADNDKKMDNSPSKVSDAAFNNQRVFKKSLPNNKLTLYLVSRDLVVSDGKIDLLQGVILIDPEHVRDKKVYGQVTLTFRYGREDEEVMGLKFCTEAIVYRAQLYPPYPGADHQEATTSLQQALIRRLGPNSHAFSMEIPPVVPPSVRLLPAKEYNGAPIGTSYDVKAYIAERVDEKLHRNSTIRMGIRVVQSTIAPASPSNTIYPISSQVSNIEKERDMPRTTRIIDDENESTECEEATRPQAAMEKPFLLSGGAIRLGAWLDRAIYAHGETITVHVTVTNNSHKSVKRLQVLVLQHVDVCMFTSGKFKNVVAVESERENCPIGPGSKFVKNYNLRPMMGSTKNWIALEDNYTKAGTNLASTVVCSGNGEKDRDPFAINVSYYVKVKLLISLMGGVVSLKLPFTLTHRNTEPDLIGFPSPVRDYEEKRQIEAENKKWEENGSLSSPTEVATIDKKSMETSLKINSMDRMANADLIEDSEEPENT